MPESSERRPEAPSLAGARPQRSRRPEAVAALRRAQSRIDQRFRQLLQTTGITLQQFEVLRILRGAGSSGLATLAIADRMADRAPGVTRLLDRLEKRQLVQRTRGEDRRQVLCSITPSGLELLDSLDERIAEVEEAVFRGLTHNEVGALAHLLERVGAGLR